MKPVLREWMSIFAMRKMMKYVIKPWMKLRGRVAEDFCLNFIHTLIDESENLVYIVAVKEMTIICLWMFHRTTYITHVSAGFSPNFEVEGEWNGVAIRVI